MSRLFGISVLQHRSDWLRATVPQPQHHWAKAHRKLFTVGATLRNVGILSAYPFWAHWLLIARTTSAHLHHNRTIKTDFRCYQLSFRAQEHSKFRTLETIPLNLPQSTPKWKSSCRLLAIQFEFHWNLYPAFSKRRCESWMCTGGKARAFCVQLCIALCHGAWLSTFWFLSPTWGF